MATWTIPVLVINKYLFKECVAPLHAPHYARERYKYVVQLRRRDKRFAAPVPSPSYLSAPRARECNSNITRKNRQRAGRRAWPALSRLRELSRAGRTRHIVARSRHTRLKTSLAIHSHRLTAATPRELKIVKKKITTAPRRAGAAHRTA
ncbi:unnamed protein product [Arctia plantaginis]|uniref:Uncharacterized protein n=1 Tax=Arctia plantaginis TaxID=874455 RepID=A0A8S0ZQV2_ARCPL|nr:unnamed protein product [Arctia plantaginis]